MLTRVPAISTQRPSKNLSASAVSPFQKAVLEAFAQQYPPKPHLQLRMRPETFRQDVTQSGTTAFQFSAKASGQGIAGPVLREDWMFYGLTFHDSGVVTFKSTTDLRDEVTAAFQQAFPFSYHRQLRMNVPSLKFGDVCDGVIPFEAVVLESRGTLHDVEPAKSEKCRGAYRLSTGEVVFPEL